MSIPTGHWTHVTSCQHSIAAAASPAKWQMSAVF